MGRPEWWDVAFTDLSAHVSAGWQFLVGIFKRQGALGSHCVFEMEKSNWFDTA